MLTLDTLRVYRQRSIDGFSPNATCSRTIQNYVTQLLFKIKPAMNDFDWEKTAYSGERLIYG